MPVEALRPEEIAARLKEFRAADLDCFTFAVTQVGNITPTTVAQASVTTTRSVFLTHLHATWFATPGGAAGACRILLTKNLRNVLGNGTIWVGESEGGPRVVTVPWHPCGFYVDQNQLLNCFVQSTLGAAQTVQALVTVYFLKSYES